MVGGAGMRTTKWITVDVGKKIEINIDAEELSYLKIIDPKMLTLDQLPIVYDGLTEITEIITKFHPKEPTK